MTIVIPLTKGQFAIVDDIDADLAELKWCASGKEHYYAVRALPGGKQEFLHIVVLERSLGRELEDNELGDHVNRRSLDNRRENLRPATHTQNRRNLRRKENGITGIYPSGSRYVAKLGYEYLGTFNTKEEAFVAHCDAAIKEHGEFASFDRELYEQCKAKYPNPQPTSTRKLSKSDYLKIKDMLQAGIRQVDIAAQFDVTQKTISAIKTGKLSNRFNEAQS